MNIHILVGDEFQINENSEILSRLYFDVNNSIFPHIYWDDFVYPMLCHWADVLIEHRNSRTARYKFHYLTGPYQLDIYQNAEQILTISFIDTSKCYQTIQISYNELAEVLYNALHDFRSIIFQKYSNRVIELEKVVKKTADCMNALKLIITY